MLKDGCKTMNQNVIIIKTNKQFYKLEIYVITKINEINSHINNNKSF